MNRFPARSAVVLLGLVGLGLPSIQARAQSAAPLQTHPDDQSSVQATQEVEAATSAKHSDDKGRRLAPYGTFFLLSYVSSPTDKGVEGFPPGQEVHFVEAHRQMHTLVVSDGRAQVEVPPSKLTNDLNIAALVRRNDEASQAQIASYVQAEQEAYDKQRQKIAEDTAKDLEHHKDQVAAADAKERQAEVGAQAAPQVSASVSNGGYYDNGGSGYGSPYSFFSDTPNVIINQGPSTGTAPAAAPAPAPAGKVAAPAGNAGGARPK